MSQQIADIKKRRAAAVTALKEVKADVYDNNGGTWSPEHKEKFESIERDIKNFTEDIQRLERLKEFEITTAAQKAESTEEKDQGNELTYREAFYNWFSSTKENPASNLVESRAIMSRGRPTKVHKRGTSTQITTTATLGGNLVPEDWEGQIIKSMAAWGGMLEAADVRPSMTGGDLPIPTLDDTGTSGAIIGQGTADTVSDLTINVITLSAYTYTSRVIKMSYELLQDGGADLDLIDILGRRLGTATNAHFTTGDGSSKPNGVVPRSSQGGSTAASNSAVAIAELIDLRQAVDEAYRRSPACRWMFNDSTLGELLKLKVGSSDATPLWQWSHRDGEPDTLLGFPFTVNPDMASFGSSAKPIIFGDFSRYRIRQVRGIEIARAQERWIDERVVGFFGFCRYDGNLLDTAAVKHLLLPV